MERCCRVRRCGHASLGARLGTNRLARDVARSVVRSVAANVAAGGGIVGGDAMSSGDGVDAMDSVMRHRVRSLVRNRGLSCALSRGWRLALRHAGLIRWRQCFQR